MAQKSDPSPTPRTARRTPRHRERVRGNDAVWLQDSPSNLMVINAVFVTERIDLQAFRDVFRQRVLDADEGRRYPRFTRRITRTGGRYWWEDDPAFELDRQIIAGPEERTLEDLQRYVGTSASEPLPADRPLWQIQVIESFETDSSALLVRIHHSMADGIALMGVIFALMEESTAEGGAAEGVAATRGQPGGGFLRGLQITLQAPFILLQRMLWPADRHSLHGPVLSGRKRVAWTTPLDLGLIKDVKDRLNATVNDVLMASVAGALSRYLQRQDGSRLGSFQVSMPVNVRPPNERAVMENRFAAVPLRLPAGLASVVQRVAAVKGRMDALKRSVEPIVVYGIVNVLLRVLPHRMSRGLIDFLANKCTAVVTNVPGPQRSITVAGRLVRSMVFWVPQRADIGLGISILSFAGRVQVGVLCDDAVVPDPGKLIEAFEEEFEELKKL